MPVRAALIRWCISKLYDDLEIYEYAFLVLYEVARIRSASNRVLSSVVVLELVIFFMERLQSAAGPSYIRVLHHS